jgi:hypothetical protein
MALVVATAPRDSTSASISSSAALRCGTAVIGTNRSSQTPSQCRGK